MANNLFYSRAKSTVSAAGDGFATAEFDAEGLAEIDASDANLVAAVEQARGVQVDWEGSSEAITDGTKQTALTLRGLWLFNGASTTILTVKEEDTNGTIIFGPITLAANAERIIIFPERLATANGTDAIFIQTPTGALAATQGFLIP